MALKRKSWLTLEHPDEEGKHPHWWRWQGEFVVGCTKVLGAMGRRLHQLPILGSQGYYPVPYHLPVTEFVTFSSHSQCPLSPGCIMTEVHKKFPSGSLLQKWSLGRTSSPSPKQTALWLVHFLFQGHCNCMWGGEDEPYPCVSMCRRHTFSRDADAENSTGKAVSKYTYDSPQLCGRWGVDSRRWPSLYICS